MQFDGFVYNLVFRKAFFRQITSSCDLTNFWFYEERFCFGENPTGMAFWAFFPVYPDSLEKNEKKLTWKSHISQLTFSSWTWAKWSIIPFLVWWFRSQIIHLLWIRILWRKTSYLTLPTKSQLPQWVVWIRVWNVCPRSAMIGLSSLSNFSGLWTT